MINEEEWLRLMSDEHRADILKTKIKEEEETKRQTIAAKKEIKTTQEANENRGHFRIGLLFLLGIIVIALALNIYCYISGSNVSEIFTSSPKGSR